MQYVEALNKHEYVCFQSSFYNSHLNMGSENLIEVYRHLLHRSKIHKSQIITYETFSAREVTYIINIK